MAPSIGRFVHLIVNPEWNNGSDVAPAVVTRVWSDTCVNLRVLLDSNTVDWVTSVALYETREAADADNAKRVADGIAAQGSRPFAAFWPPRV